MGKKRKRSLARKSKRKKKRREASSETDKTQTPPGAGSRSKNHSQRAVPIDQEAFKKALLESFSGGVKPAQKDAVNDSHDAEKIAQEALPRLLGSLAQQFSATLQDTVTTQVTANLADKESAPSASPADDATLDPTSAAAPSPDNDRSAEVPGDEPVIQGTQEDSDSDEGEDPVQVDEPESEPDHETNPNSQARTGSADIGAAFKDAVNQYVVNNVDDASRDQQGNVNVDIDGEFIAEHGGRIIASLFGNLAQSLTGADASQADTNSDAGDTASPDQVQDNSKPDKPKVSFNFDLNKMVGQLLAASQKKATSPDGAETSSDGNAETQNSAELANATAESTEQEGAANVTEQPAQSSQDEPSNSDQP